MVLSCALINQTQQKCGFDPVKQARMKIQKTELHREGGRFLEDTPWTPIRIYIDYTTLEGQAAQLNQGMVDNLKVLIDKVSSAFTSLINVKASKSKLKISMCDDKTKISPELSTNGVDADIVIFPYVDMSFPETTEAAAIFCGNDNVTGRPTAGYVAFNKFMNFDMKNAMYYYSLLVFHEMNHIFSFNQALFEMFIDDKGETLPKDKVVATKVVNGVKRDIIITPKVVAAAKKHFNCDSIDGIELENQGGDGTAGNHWEMRVMAGDFMIGESYGENVISDITLALMEDSGWYKTNYYTGGLFRFGKNQGCDFLNTKCVTNGVTKFPNEYNPVVNAPFCFSGRTSKGLSSLRRKSVAAAYQYFSDPALGGTTNADFCPIAQDMSFDDMFFGMSCLKGKSVYPAAMGEKLGTNSNCFISSLTPTDADSLAIYKGKDTAICYDIICNSEAKNYSVYIGDKSFICPFEGGEFNVPGFDGVLKCPVYDLLCNRVVPCSDVIDCIERKSTPVTLMNLSTSRGVTDGESSGSYINFIYAIYAIFAIILV